MSKLILSSYSVTSVVLGGAVVARPVFLTAASDFRRTSVKSLKKSRWLQRLTNGCSGGLPADHVPDMGFGDDGDAELFRFVAFGAAAFAGEDEVGFGGDRAADLAAVGFDEGFHVIAVDAERAGDDEGFSGERTGC